VSIAIFGSLAPGAKLENLESVKTPYLILGAAFLLVAFLFKISSLPNQIHHEDSPAAKDASTQAQQSVISYPQLWMGMLAIFLYVGVEVATASNLPEFMKQKLNVPTDQVSPYVSLFWASLMIGRWSGAVGAFNISERGKKVLSFVLPYVAFGVFMLVNYLAHQDLAPFYAYLFVIPIIIVADLMSKGNPARQLVLFSVLGIVALLLGIFASGLISAYAFISVGLFCSTLWPCIFTLAIAGLGKKTNDGASFLIMMIMGGGLVSWLQGYLAKDELLGIQFSYLVGVVCFVYLGYYGLRARAILSEQGIDYDQSAASAH
jgi:FHS family L-fucose permease-like MFS transporter